MDVWRAMISAQGGDPDAALPTARETEVITAAEPTGCCSRWTRWRSGVAAWRLGAGRARKEDPVQAGAGVELHAKPGDRVTRRRSRCSPCTPTPRNAFDRAREALADACVDRPERRPDRHR